MSLEEAILERVRRLPAAKQEEVLRFADGLGQQAAGPAAARDRTREMKWVKEHRLEFANRWVAVHGDQLIAADVDALKVFSAAKAQGIRTPFVVHILPEDSQPFVSGW